MSQVSLVKCDEYDEYDEELVYQKVKEAVELLGGIGKFIEPNSKVLIKPNILGPHSPDEAVCTHPSVVKAVIRLVRPLTEYISVGDSPGFGSAEAAARRAGILQAVENTGARFVDLRTPAEVNFPGADQFKQLIISKEVLKADFIINVPKFKTHQLTGITAAVKNLFGCVPGVVKSQYHLKVLTREKFESLIVDIARFVKPSLGIVDAIVAMEGEGGPGAGQPKKLGLIAASSDQVALDAVLSEVVGIDPLSIATTRLGQRTGLGKGIISEIEIIGENIQNVKCPDFAKIEVYPELVMHLPVPKALHNFVKNLISEKPLIDRRKCTNCRTCIKVCSPVAMSDGKPTPKFDYNKCIRCFCCAEMCPEKAVYVKKSRFAAFLIDIINRLGQ